MKNRVMVGSRQVHLDFHTSPAIPDVGRDFDAHAFADTMKKAHVNSVTLFAKCHHGHLYYNTARPERHPGLKKGFGLLEKQIEALKRQGIRTPIYISVQCDEYAANTHPEWVARKPDGAPVKWGDSVFKPGWQILDMSSPYQEYLFEQTEEVLKHFAPVDGLFFDMCWDQQSTTQWAIDGMTQRNLNPESEADRRIYAHDVSLQYMKRFFDLTRSCSGNAGVYFNARPLSNLANESQYLTQVEIEALPSGGWGYMYFPKNVRFVRTQGRPYLGMTARFHKSWADFGGLKPYAALEYETSQMVAHGASCSIGDQLHPRGILDPAAYELIGRAYSRLKEREPWLIDATPVTQIGVLSIPPANAANNMAPPTGSDEGAVRMLTQLKHQFNFLDEAGDLNAYELLILPDSLALSESLIRRLRKYLSKGGAILASGTSGLASDGSKVLLPELGIVPRGFSPFTATYVRFGKRIDQGIPATEHVMYDRSVRAFPDTGAISLATVVEPYFERAWNHFSSHSQTPPDKPSKFSAAVQNGKVGYIAYPVFSSYATHANLPCRWLVSAMIDRLLPEALLRVTAPSSTEATVTHQAGRTIVHLLQYCPERRGKDLDIVEDIVPLYNVKISLRLPRIPMAVHLAPGKQTIDFAYSNGRVEVTVPKIDGHAMVAFK
jgi:hypothetical protein